MYNLNEVLYLVLFILQAGGFGLPFFVMGGIVIIYGLFCLYLMPPVKGMYIVRSNPLRSLYSDIDLQSYIHDEVDLSLNIVYI